MAKRTWTHWLMAITVGLAVTLVVTQTGCSSIDDSTVEASEDWALSCGDGSSGPELGCPALPNTLAVGKMINVTVGSTTKTVLDYDMWAWNSFIALNWPAADPSQAPPQNSSAPGQRGLPDTTNSFAGASYNATAVWETFKEKREIFLYNYVNSTVEGTGVPLGWNEEPQYGPSDAQVPCCTPGGCDTGGDVFERHLANASGTFSDTLDETAEVASQARETTSVLCAGYTTTTTPTLAQCQTMFPQGSEATLATRPPVGPRVFYQGPGDSQPNPLLYEVKLNRGYFDYVFDNEFYNVTVVRNHIATNATFPVTLPARTNNTTMPPVPGTKSTPGPNPGPRNYLSATCLAQYQAGNQACDTGAIQLKAGWINLENASEAVRQTYHTADVLHYRSDDSFTGGICKEPATYGLAGLHIIQRIHQASKNGGGNASGPPQGGTFVFATWEHTGNDDPTKLSYSNVLASNTSQTFPKINGSNHGGIPLNRLYPPLDSTVNANTLVHQAISDANSSSVWLNYRLIGVQYASTTPTTPPTQVSSLTPQQPAFEYPPGSGQPYYLANLVVESNVGLQQFQGLPPSDPTTTIIRVIPHYINGTSPVNASVTSQFKNGMFQRTAENLAFRTRKGGNTRPMEYNMGGCMGCHGVAQLSGYSFSFVLLDNQFGGAPDTIDDFTIPPVDPPLP